MKINFTNIFIFLFLSATKGLYAQQLQIGDKMPDFAFTNIFNYEKSEAQFSDFAGKPVILDFWATWCTPCVATFSKVNSLQKELGGKLQFILITNEKRDDVKRFYARLGIKDVRLPTLTDNSVLSKLVAVRFVPHYVWIDKKGVIRAQTNAEAITKENIDKFLTEQPLNLPVKKDVPRFPVDFNYPLLIDTAKLRHAEILSYSLLTRIKGASSMLTIPTKGVFAWRRILITTLSISGLYSVAYGDGFRFHKFPYARTVLAMRDTVKYNYYSHLPDSLNNGNLYCYEMIIPEADSVKLFNAMQKDLREKFGLKISIEDRLTECLVLKLGNPKKLRTPHPKDSVVEYNQYSITMNNHPVSELVDVLSQYYESREIPAIIDETKYKGNISIEFSGVDIKDYNALKKELSENGLLLSKEKRKVSFLVLSDTKLAQE